MSVPFIGEIRMVGFNFPPQGWANCDGQLLAISQNEALFSLVGTIYGGDGRTTFGLPDLRSRVAMHAGNGSGLTQRRIGQKAGAEGVTLTPAQVAAHNHPVNCSNEAGTSNNPTNNFPAADGTGFSMDYHNVADAEMNSSMVVNSGGSQPQPHENRQPVLVIRFIIALVGVYPSRS